MRLPTALLLAAGSALTAPAAQAQVSLTGTTYTQNFNTLASSGTTNTTVPSGWSFLEGGANANTTYAAGTGSDTGGNTYSFGATSSAERAFGMLQSGSLNSIIGFKFTNDTGSTITTLDIAYIGEQWRRAAAADTLSFSYQLANVALNAASGWTSVSALNFVTSVTGAGASLDGNATANQSSRSSSLTGLNIANGTTVTFRWVDATASSSAGMAIDDFSLTATLFSSPPPASGTGLYWAGSSGSGGAGTWSASSATFATDTTFAETNLEIGTGTVVFAGATGGTVTIDGGVSVASGLRFSTTGYTLSSSTLTLAGASTAANALTVDADVAATIGSTIDGTTGLTKAGAGTLVLTGPNTYTGGTTVSAGKLTVSTASLSGNVANSGNVTFDQASDATYAGAVTGTGSLTKEGAGNLTLTGANAHTGGTTISTGTLTVSTASLSGAITNNAALAFNQASDGTYAGTITGTGSLTKSGAGNLTLSGANNYSGGTTISTGILTGSSSSITGAVTNSAALVFNQASAGTYAGTITGSGSVTKSGAGNLTLTGANNYSGGTTVSTGTLTVSSSSIAGAIANNAALVFDQASAGTYAGVISGAGTLAKTGVGALTLSGNSSSFSGVTTISAGSVVASHANALGSGAVTIAGGASLVASNGVAIANSLTLSQPASGGFIISEYIEGSSNNKYIELYNGTGQILDLSQYRLRLYGNGSSTATNPNTLFNLSNYKATLAAGEVMVLAHSTAAITPVGVVTYSAGDLMFFNGDDAIALETSDGAFVDIFGVIGNDPGAIWGTLGSGFETAERTLVRKSSVLTGVSVNPSGTGISGFTTLTTEWDSLPQNDVSNLGTHVMTVPPSGPVTLGTLAASSNVEFSGGIVLGSAATLTAAADATATFSGILSGAGSVTKTGNGIVTLTGTNTYSGGTTISAGKLIIGNIGSLGSGNVTVSGGILDLNNLAPTNVILVSGGSLLNASAWAALGAVQLSGNVDSEQINNLGADITEVKVAAGATVNLAGVTKDIVFEGGTLTNLADFGSGRKIKVKGSLDVSAGDHGGDIEVAAGGTLDFGNRSTDRTVKFAGGAITGANFTGTVDVDSAAGTVDLTSSIGAGNVRIGNGSSASIQAGFNRDLRLESGATLSGLNNYSGELTVAAPTFSTSGITTSATIAIESGTKLTGTGTVGSVVQVAGSTLAPGNSPGILNVTGTHVLAGGAAMEVEFYDLAASQVRGTAYDGVTAGTLDLSGLTTISRYTLNLVSLSALPNTQGALDGFDNSTPYLFELFTYATLTLPASYTGNIADLFTISAAGFDDANGNAVTGSWTVFNNTGTSTLELQYSPIPEPSTYGLILGGLALAGAAIRRRRKQSA